MKINWALRFKNKATLSTIVAALVAMVYQICGAFGVVPPISESEVVNFMGMIINLLCVLGILVDPTTKGMSDSDRAMGYTDPD